MRSRVGLCCALVLAGIGSFGACQNRTPSNTPLGGVDEPPPETTSSTQAREKPEKKASAPAEEEKKDEREESEEESDDEEKDGEENAGGASNEGDGKKDSKSSKTSALGRRNGVDAGNMADVPPLCDDSKPATLNCRPLSDRCPPLAPICTLIETTFKPKVGQAIVDCAAKKECGVAQFDCLRPALRKSCVDDAARSICEERLKTCKKEYKRAEVTQQDCEHGLGSLLPDVRARMEACMSDSCDVRACIARILPSPVSDEDEDDYDDSED